MIYILGGPPRCGKTTLAKALSKKTGINYLVADDIQKVIRAYIPESEQAVRLPFRAVELENGYDNDLIYGRYSPSEIVSMYIAQSAAYLPGFKALIQHCLKEDIDYILEGHIFQPSFVSELGTENIRVAYAYKEDAAELSRILRAGSGEGDDWVKQQTKDSETFPKIATMIIEYGNYLKTEAEKYGLPSYAMDGAFSGHIDRITDSLILGA